MSNQFNVVIENFRANGAYAHLMDFLNVVRQLKTITKDVPTNRTLAFNRWTLGRILYSFRGFMASLYVLLQSFGS